MTKMMQAWMYVNRWLDRQTNRQTKDRQTDRQTHTLRKAKSVFSCLVPLVVTPLL